MTGTMTADQFEIRCTPPRKTRPVTTARPIPRPTGSQKLCEVSMEKLVAVASTIEFACRELKTKHHQLEGVSRSVVCAVQVKLHRGRDSRHEGFEVELDHLGKTGQVARDCHAEELGHGEGEPDLSTS